MSLLSSIRRTITNMAASPAAKRARIETSGPLIGTHNGHFHADEALAVYMLRMLPKTAASPLVRTRDPAKLATCDIVVDVGGEYDVARRRFDHHQRGFATTFPGRQTKLSSAGLVYMHFGRSIIARQLGQEDTSDEDLPDDGAAAEARAKEQQQRTLEGTSSVDILHRKLYESFIEAVDANDNGISKYDPAALSAAGIEKKYSDGGYSLGGLVSRHNPSWNDPIPSDPIEAQAAEDDRFHEASTAIGQEFHRELAYYVNSWLPARSFVKTAFDARQQYDPDGRVLVFEGGSVPWKDHLYSLEEEQGESASRVLYVLYPENTKPDSKWRIQCVPESKDSFVSRKPLPEAWRGFRGEELDGISGIPGCVFVHAAGFIGGNKTFDGVKAMVEKALAA